MLKYLTEPTLITIDKKYALSHVIISKEPEINVIDYMTEYRIQNKIQVFTEVGFDVPVSDEQSQQGLRGYEYWIIVDEETYNNHQHDTVQKKIVPKGKYLMLNIDNPFVDPFERIPNGWKKIWAAIESDHKFREGLDIYGFEEKIDTLYNTSMNIYVPVE